MESLDMKLYTNIKSYSVTWLAKYLFGLNRYMWLDSAAHQCFDDYVDVINQLYVKPRLEIEVW